MNNFAPRRRKDYDHCPGCHSMDLEERPFSGTVEFRGLNLDIENLHYIFCLNCKNKFENSKQKAHNDELMREAFTKKRDELRVQDGLLSSDQIQEIRQKFALTQREAAVIFGGGANAFNKYETGEVLQSVAMDRLLRLVGVAGVPAVKFLEHVAQRVRRDFHLEVDHKQPLLEGVSIQLIFGNNNERTHLNIQQNETKEEIRNIISSKMFTQVSNFEDTPSALSYLPPFDVQSQIENSFYKEIKND